MTVQTITSNKKRTGKPRIYKDRMMVYSITIDEDTIKMALVAGDGNLSRGIRELVKIGYEQSKKGLSE